MGKVITLKQAENITKELQNETKTIVLVGGCFDLLHLGHINFLKKAKQAGDQLFIALESDENVKRRKGEGRPINSQKDRAEILASLEFVDFVIILPDLRGFENYLALVKNLNPNIIAVTEGDYHLKQKEDQAKQIGAKVLVVSPLLRSNSTTKIARLLEKEL